MGRLKLVVSYVTEDAHSYCLGFDSYMQEKEKAAEDHKQNIAEYRKFLESCDFIKVSLVKGICTCILL